MSKYMTDEFSQTYSPAARSRSAGVNAHSLVSFWLLKSPAEMSSYTMVLSLQNSMPPQILREQPVVLEDPLGRIVPFHVEFVDCFEVSPGKKLELCWSSLM